MPLPSPSILVPGQLRKKNLASAHEVICEQWVRPSQRYAGVIGWLCLGAVRVLGAGACCVFPMENPGTDALRLFRLTPLPCEYTTAMMIARPTSCVLNAPLASCQCNSRYASAAGGMKITASPQNTFVRNAEISRPSPPSMKMMTPAQISKSNAQFPDAG